VNALHQWGVYDAIKIAELHLAFHQPVQFRLPKVAVTATFGGREELKEIIM